MIKIIAACSKNRVIGKGNKLIWKVPGDLKRFKEMTTGHIVVMGRKTFESIGKPLPNRGNVILTRNHDFKVEGCEISHSIEEIMKFYGSNMFVIGGAEIYKEFLPYADIIELTYIYKEFEGDAYFPEFSNEFKEIKREDHECDEFKYSFLTYFGYPKK